MKPSNKSYKFTEIYKSVPGILHDLANPLTTVSLNLNLLKQKSLKNKQITTEIQILIDRALRGTHELEKLVESARLQIKKQDSEHVFSVEKQIGDAIGIVGSRAKKANISISFPHTEKIYTYGSSAKFSQLIANLLANAIDSYLNFSKIKKLVKIKLALNSANIIIKITDQGVGINKQNLPLIFEPQFTTKPGHKGTGIGLYMCKNIVENNFKGTLNVKNNQKAGTTFIIEFPVKTVTLLSDSTFA